MSFLRIATLKSAAAFQSHLASLGIELSTAMKSHVEAMIFGSLIVLFLAIEPRGLARLWAIGKEKLRIWPFPH